MTIKIAFDLEEFKKWMEVIGDDQGSYRIIDGNIICRYTSFINGIWKDHEDIDLEGELIDDTGKD